MKLRLTATILTLISLIFGVSSSVKAQINEGFGKNKVQYRTFDFEVIETEHFKIHYYPEEKQASERAARMAERCYTRLSRVLNHDFDKKETKPVILYSGHNHFQQTNIIPGLLPEGVGGVTEGNKDRLIMPIDGSYEHFDQVLCHEIVHEFQYDIAGVRLQNLPRWFVEGMAEYLSKGRVDSRSHARMRDALIYGYDKTIPEMNKDDGYLAYRFGEVLWSYIGTVYGDPRIGDLLKVGYVTDANYAFERELGVNVDTLSSRWVKYLKKAYPSADSTTADLPFESPSLVGNRITDHKYTDNILPEPSYLGPSLSPDGKTVAYLSEEANELYRFWDLWTASSENGSNKKRLVQAGRSAGFESLEFMNSAPSWSPDGDQLVFSSQYKGKDVINFYNIEDGDQERIELSDKTIVGIQNPRISPDGSQIVFTGVSGGESDLYLINKDGSNLQHLTEDPYTDLHPDWSPDGERIVFSSDRGHETDWDNLVYSDLVISVVDVSTGRVSVLPGQNKGENTNPAWSPDGEWVAFVSDRTGVSDVFLVSVETGELRRLTKGATSVRGVTQLSPALSWADGSNKLAFSYFEGGGYNIYVVDNPEQKAESYDHSSAFKLTYPDPERILLYVRADSIETSSDSTENSEDELEDEDGQGEEDSTPPPRIIGFKESNIDQIIIPVGYNKMVDQYSPSISDLVADKTLGLPDLSDFTYSDYDDGLGLDGFCPPSIGGTVGSGFNDGVGGRGCVRLSDLMGDKRMFALLDIPGGNIFHDSRVFWGYSNLKHRLNYGLSLSQFPFYRFYGSGFAENQQGQQIYRSLIVRNTYRNLSANLSYPRSKFDRFELNLMGANIRRDIIRYDATRDGERNKNAENLNNLKFIAGSVGWVYDNALPSFSHFIDGNRLRVRFQKYYGDWSLNSFNIDARKYWKISGRFSLAARLTSMNRFGKGSDNFRTYWGRSYYLRGYDFDSFEERECIASQIKFGKNTPTGCPVRDQLIGTSSAFFSAEFRFPISNPIDTGISFLPPIGGALFFDAGTSFNSMDQIALSRDSGVNPFKIRTPVTSLGVEVRLNIGIANLRFGRAWTPSRSYKGGQFYFSFWPTF